MKIVIIGGGPGGYVAAIRCAQYGGEVTVIEKKHLGGTCVNEGCIPTKALLKGVQPLIEWKHFKSMGFSADNPTIDKDKLQKHVQKVVKISRQGIGYLMKKNNINVVNGEAIGYRNRSVIVKKENGEEVIPYDKLILAMGSVSSDIPGIKVDGEKIVYSDVPLKLEKIPTTMLIVGGGVIGLEMATIYSQLGTEVTIVEWLDQLLACEDAEAVKVIEKNLI
ncbi:MAG: FAD-dependent oxidoreductase, partial [Caldisericia bacterium]|nr:FAD-dependent oxidoreductase [Caldisericia bacterium]